MIYLLLATLVLTAVGFAALTVGLARTIGPPEDPCEVWCQYARDVAMDPYHSCAHGCVYDQMG